MREPDFSCLRAAVSARMSDYRYSHTLGVESMVARLAALYCPKKEMLLRAAALLHDITKELSDEAQLSLLSEAGITLRPDEQASPKIYHGITAPLLIARDFPAYADEELLLAVRWHTTGRVHMTLSEALLYLADYIEEGRRFPECEALRARFFDANPIAMTAEARRAHLRAVILSSLEMTVEELLEKGAPVCRDTVAARDWLKTETNPFERI